MTEVLVDVRTPEEYAEGHLDGALNIPHEEFVEKAHDGELSEEETYLVYCHTGARARWVRDNTDLDVVVVQERFG